MSSKNPKASPAGKTESPVSRPAEPAKTGSVPGGPPPVTPEPQVKPPPLFRGIDWLTFAIAALITFVVYVWTLAPDVTLEDSGELAVASKYAGVPHPPGYPVWTVYTWLFTLLPISNIAYRVGLSSAFAGAISCGIIGMMVSRGSSMLLEGIEFFRGIDLKLERWFCLVSGLAAGLLMGFNGFMWSQAVIVEVYTLSVLSLTLVLACLMRWIHAPVQRRYLYFAFFWFGICFNNHQSLLVIAMGLETAIVVASPRLGRELLFWNVVVFVGGLAASMMGFISMLNDNGPVMLIYCGVGIASLITWLWLVWKTQKSFIEFVRDIALVATLACFTLIFLKITNYVSIFDLNQGRYVLVWMVGLASLGTFVILTWFPGLAGFKKPLGPEWGHALGCGVGWAAGASCYVYMALSGMTNPPLNWGYPRTVTGFIHAFTRGQYERIHPTIDFDTFLRQIYFTLVDGTVAEFSILCILFGVAVFFWWVSRQDWSRERKWGMTLGTMFLGALVVFLNWEPVVDTVNAQRGFYRAVWVLGLMLAYGCLVPVALILVNPTFLFWKEMKTRERAWMVGLMAIYICLGPFLMILLNPQPDRQSQDLNKVFFTASHVLIAMGIGYALTLLLALLHNSYAAFRKFALVGIGLGVLVAAINVGTVYGDSSYFLHHFTALYALILAAAGGLLLFIHREKAPLGSLMVLIALAPGYPMLAHWEGNEQRGHLFGFWFGHDMFTPPFEGKDKKPLYPEMPKHTILFGGTDPGRFNPTYMIFCESFIPKDKKRDENFDRRDVYLITQNALADGTYLQYIRAHYNRSTQDDPPFFTELLRGPKELAQNYTTNWIARLAQPLDNYFLTLGANIEKERRVGTSWFAPDQFTDFKAFAAKLKAAQDPVSKYLVSQLRPEIQQAVQSGADDTGTRDRVSKDLNRVLEAGPLWDAQRFENVKLSEHVRLFTVENPQGHTRIRLNRLLLEEAYPAEIVKSLGGVYPDREINTPSNDDSQRCFSEYIEDANRRLQHDMQNPGAPRQIRAGEDVKMIGGKVQVQGQVAVMAINGLLTKVIFDKNPNHEFYVEESFPLDWMYPHLSPYGIIMKINRNPVAEMTQEMVDRDHEFWSQYSERLIGNWITYDTSIEEICKFVEKLYLRRDYSGFKGDRAFVRDNDAQKAFSKLRSSIGGLYQWRATNPKSAEEQRRMLKEVEFAFKQAFAFCPYSPEAVFRYMNILVNLNRFDEAILLTETSLKFDPRNVQLRGLVEELRRMQRQTRGGILPPQPATPAASAGGQPTPGAPDVAAMEKDVAELLAQLKQSPTNLRVSTKLVATYMGLGKTNEAVQITDSILQNNGTDAGALLFAASLYNQYLNFPKAEAALAKYAALMGDSPEAWFDLAGMQAIQSKNINAMQSMKKALQLASARGKKPAQPGAPPPADLLELAKTDPRFAVIREMPEFKTLMTELAQ